MCKPVDVQDYIKRARFYYENIGGIYGELIKILDELTDNFEDDELCTIKILNNASYWKDMIRLSPDENNPRHWIAKNLDPLTLCVLACIAADDRKLVDNLTKVLEGDKVYYPCFKDLIDKLVTRKSLTFYKNQNQELTEKVQTLLNVVSDQKDTIEYLHGLIDIYMKGGTEEPSDYDIDQDPQTVVSLTQMLTLDGILQWAKNCGRYSKAKNVFEMLENFKQQVEKVPDEEWLKVSELENKMMKYDIDHPVSANIMATGCNIIQGSVFESLMPIGASENELMKLFMQFLKEYKDGKQQ